MVYINEHQKAWRKSEKEIQENWDLAFGKKEEKKDESKEEEKDASR